MGSAAYLNAFRELAKAGSHSRPTEPAAAAYLVAVGQKSPRAGVLLDELLEAAIGAAIERDALLAAIRDACTPGPYQLQKGITLAGLVLSLNAAIGVGMK